MYNRIKADPAAAVTPCTVIFGAKAAPGYHQAKRIIKLINSVAAVVNADPDVAGRIKVVFLPDYNVSVAELVVAAGNVSEQISLAGKEASGTGNMKLALNGAVTVGTLDGANIEIRDRVGPTTSSCSGSPPSRPSPSGRAVTPRAPITTATPSSRPPSTPSTSGAFSGGDRDAFEPVISSILDWDEYLVLADYRSYIDCHDRAVGPAWADEDRWTRMSILNTARSGFFSSDRTVRDYCRDIWHIEPVPVPAHVATDPEAISARSNGPPGPTPRGDPPRAFEDAQWPEPSRVRTFVPIGPTPVGPLGWEERIYPNLHNSLWLEIIPGFKPSLRLPAAKARAKACLHKPRDSRFRKRGICRHHGLRVDR